MGRELKVPRLCSLFGHAWEIAGEVSGVDPDKKAVSDWRWISQVVLEKSYKCRRCPATMTERRKRKSDGR